jgi:hypothetical protein
VASLIEFALERFRDIRRDEMDSLFALHWQEIGLYRDKIPLDVDYARYEELDRTDALHIITARCEGHLIGYHCSIISTHPHYKSSKMALVDVYFLLPEYRMTRASIKLFQFAEESLKARGDIVKLLCSTKVHQDHSRIFEFLGWQETERTYSKVF